jgi:hypothetical protein
MNIVQMIMDFLARAGWNKLSSLLGESEAKTESAVGAAVPAILAGLARLASTKEGAQGLASALGKVDPGSFGNIDNLLKGQASSLADRGGSLLSSLFGGNVLSSIAGSIAGFAGIDGDKSKNLLGFLAPVVMGGLAKQFMGKSISPEGLMSFFADQRANITDALPRGLSLPDDILPAYNEPRTTRLHTSEHTAYSDTRTTSDATPAFPNWLLPLLGLAALFALAYLFWPRGNPEQPGVANRQTEVVRRDVARPPLETTNTKAPDVNLVQDLTGNLSSLTSALTGTKDLVSARAAVPQLTELATKLDGMKALVNNLPSAGKTEVTNLIKANVDPLIGQLNRVLMIPGASDLLRPILERIAGSIAMLGGIQPAQFALPGIDVTKVGSGLSTATSASRNRWSTGCR